MKHQLLFILVLFFFNNTLKAQYIEDSKKPGGMYVFANQLDDIFPKSTFTYLYGSIADVLKTRTILEGNQNIIIVANNYYVSDNELDDLVRYLHAGNDVLLLAKNFSTNVKERLRIEGNFEEVEMTNYVSVNIDKNTSRRINTTQTNIQTGYFYPAISEAKTLGETSNGNANFIHKNVGAGNLYINLQPQIVTNYFLIEKGKKNYEYTETVLSYLKKTASKVLIILDKSAVQTRYGGSSSSSSRSGPSGSKSGNKDNETNQSSSSGDDSPTFMDYVDKQPNLKAAMWVALLAFLLAVIFATKRIQRQIPIVKPIENHSLDFAKTVGDLYYKVGSNDDIARKKIIYWQEHVRTKYGLPTNKLDDLFWQQLTKKSGYNPTEMTNLTNSIAQVKAAKKVSDYALVQLCNNIDKFYKA